MNNITYEYAQNLEQNEKAWEQRREKLSEVVMFFAKNTILQFTACEVNMRAIDLHYHITKGDRGDFLSSEIDGILTEFEEIKKAYAKSGLSESLAEMSRRITNKALGKND